VVVEDPISVRRVDADFGYDAPRPRSSACALDENTCKSYERRLNANLTRHERQMNQNALSFLSTPKRRLYMEICTRTGKPIEASGTPLETQNEFSVVLAGAVWRRF